MVSVLTQESFKKENFVVRDTLIKSDFLELRLPLVAKPQDCST